MGGKSVRQAEKETRELKRSVHGMLAERKRQGKPIPTARRGTSLYRSQQNMLKRQKKLKKLVK